MKRGRLVLVRRLLTSLILMPDPGSSTREALLEELAKQGVKHSPEHVVAIARDAGGRVVFLEEGNARAGLVHIVAQHAADFARRGISEAQIPDAVMQAA